MAASETVIGNAALGKLGQGPVLSFDDPDDKARWLKSRFAAVRDMTLRGHRWSFAMKREQLSADTDKPAFGYGQQFTLPGDFLALVELNGVQIVPGISDYVFQGRPGYAIESGKILTDAGAPLQIRYVWRNDNPSSWDALFDEALACRLASDLCEKLTQSTSKGQAAMQAYQMAIREAVKVNAIENASEEAPDGSWLLARL